MSPLSTILAEKRILVCVGSGGVGKTTTAAALALRAAIAGHKTLVLTIDPAKRLANSLGLDSLGHEVQRVSDELVLAAAQESTTKRDGKLGQLHAMMLDQQRAFDELVEGHAANPEAVKRILENPVYKQISGSLAGSQEYAAMAKLHDFDKAGEFDVIVVDTPPTAHALDFLDAPRKLTEAIDSPAIDWFRKLNDSKGGWSVVGRTGNYFLKRLSKFVGTQFLDDLAVFFGEFNDILGGFRERAEETFETLRQDKVGFILVASPEAMAIQEAEFFFGRLKQGGLPFSSFIINRVHDDLPIEGDLDSVCAELKSEPAVAALAPAPVTLKIAAEAMMQAHKNLQLLAAADKASVEKLRSLSPEVETVPFLDQDVHDLAQLAVVGDYLFGDR